MNFVLQMRFHKVLPSDLFAIFDSLDAYLLMSLVEFDTFPGVSDVKDLEVETLLRWLRVQVDEKLQVYTKEELA